MHQSQKPVVSDDSQEEFEQILYFIPVLCFLAVNPLSKCYQFQHNIVSQTYSIIPLVIFLDWIAYSLVTEYVLYKSLKVFNF